ncbi:MAG: MaoC family dehydratase [Chthoniobacterales bacterium]
MSRTFADFKPGDELVSATYTVTGEEIVAFAKQFDPQPAHLDDEAGGESLLGGLAASGWQTAAISMRLFVEVMNVGVGMIGVAVDELRWPKPVRPDDQLRVEIEILETRLSEKRPGFGVLRYRSLTRNQDDEVVQSFCATAILSAGAGDSLGEKQPGQ